MGEAAVKFLDLYKQLEDELEQKYRNSKRKFSSVIYEFLRDVDSEPVHGDLDVCREIRNLLTHNANLGGQPVVEPSEHVIKSLQDIIAYVKRPPLAIEFATKTENIIKANLSQKVIRLMEVMVKNGFSHVPVMAEGEWHGVFSVGTIFQYTVKTGRHIGKETKLSELKGFLSIQEQLDNYCFIDAEGTYLQVRKMFERVPGKNKRVSVVFVTDNGHWNGRLLGMLTPWDVMGTPE